MPVKLQPPPGRSYRNEKEARDAWERGEAFVVNDTSHPLHLTAVTRRDITSEPVTLFPRPQ